MEPEGRGQEAPDVRLAAGGLRRVRGVAVREGHAHAGAVRQRLRDGGLPEDPPALRRLPDAPELPDQEGGGGTVKTTVVVRFKAEVECVWEYRDEPGQPQFSVPSIGSMRGGMAIPYNWVPISLRVTQETQEVSK